MFNVYKSKITGTGIYLPKTIYTNEYLQTLTNTNADWIVNTLGIKQRRIAAQNQSTSDLAAAAASQAINNAKLFPTDIELIIIATTTPDRWAPSTATIVQQKIGAINAAAFDILAVCSGFLYGVYIGSQFISSNTYKNILIVGADAPSRITDWTKRDCVFFGDGAGAVVLSNSDDGTGFQNFSIFSNGDGITGFTIPAGGSQLPASQFTIDNNFHTFKMNGRQVYEAAIRVMPQAIMSVLSKSNLTINDIDLLIPHQPNIKILKKVAQIVGISFERVIVNLDKYANTIAGTIPIALHQAKMDNKLTRGKKIIIVSVGAGWTWGAGLYQC